MINPDKISEMKFDYTRKEQTNTFDMAVETEAHLKVIGDKLYYCIENSNGEFCGCVNRKNIVTAYTRMYKLGTTMRVEFIVVLNSASDPFRFPLGDACDKIKPIVRQIVEYFNESVIL